MENVSSVEKLESIRSLRSTINKSENALAKMSQEGANTTLIKKRLKAHRVGMAMLENVLNQKPHDYIREDMTEARSVLVGLFPLLQKNYTKSKVGSPQRTLLERRIKALELAVQAIDDHIK